VSVVTGKPGTAYLPAITLELTTDEALSVLGALNVSSVLRNTTAPVTTEQLERGRAEGALAERVLLALAALEGKSCPVDSHAADCTCFGEHGDR